MPEHNFNNKQQNVFILEKTNKKMKRGLMICFVFGIVLILVSNVSAIYLGITDGYIKNMNGEAISGASVTVTVQGCSGDGCSKTVTSESNGYYVANNLNLPKNGQVSVSATKNGGSGSNTGTADNYQIAHVNVTICYPPTSPSLTNVPDGDENEITFLWSSGTDPLGLTKHDEFKLDSGSYTTRTSPYSTTVDWGSHTWYVRTCNSQCCSPASSDDFTITCPAPTAPTLTDVPNSHDTTITFSWTSGTDPYSRTTWDNFQLDSGSITNESSPIQRTVGLGSHIWRVRTCNELCCSGWSSDTFATANSAPSKPTNTNFTSIGGGLTELSWDSGIDPDGDTTYDEFVQLNESGDTILSVSPATSPQTVASHKLLIWRVRTCDSFDACSSWVDVYSVTCEELAEYCPPCPEAEEIETIVYRGGGYGALCMKLMKGAELYCNGIAFANASILKIDINSKDKKTKLSIYGMNLTLEDLEYCPWCYDGVKDYDEEGIDCGGSCKECFEIERPFGVSWKKILIVAVAGLAIIGIIYSLKYRKKLQESRRKTNYPKDKNPKPRE